MHTTTIRLLNAHNIEQHIAELISIEPKFLPIYQTLGIPDLRKNDGGFSQLMRAIIGQQLSTTAAKSIWQRLENANLINEQRIIQSSDEDLRQCGLSRQKIRYLRSLAEHQIDFVALNDMSDEQVIAVLTDVTGIGVWTAQMYLLFSLGRADVLATDDLAIKVASAVLLDLPARPTAKQLDKHTQHWSPYRSAASLLLWSFYGDLKQRNALPL